MNRRQIRENVFKMLFRIEFHDAAELDQQLNLFEKELQEELGTEDPQTLADITYAKTKCSEIINRISDIDGQINSSVVGWKTGRMSKMDLAILRLAVYEIRYEDSIPMKVAINEAVELAKKYGTADSPAFVNGVLAKMVK